LTAKSHALYDSGSLRFYDEHAIRFRNHTVNTISRFLEEEMKRLNQAWVFKQVEGPQLTPAEHINPNYTDRDVFFTNHSVSGMPLALRAETTVSSYKWADYYHKDQPGNKVKLPFCIWQVGKSFRREMQDGARAATLRFNEFYQLEFQCFYSEGSKCQYRDEIIKPLCELLVALLGVEVRTVVSDRLPSYSESTIDIEATWNGEWKEVASLSIRKDYHEGIKVAEFAFGLDRLIEIASDNSLRNAG
jgi:glycyl-tRNA synthetase